MKFSFKPLFGALILLLGVFATDSPAQAWMNSHLPLTPAEVAHTFPVKWVGEFNAGKTQGLLPVGPGGVELSQSVEGQFLITGQDALRRPFSYAWSAFAFTAYVADLDGNGRQDLVLLAPTFGNGLAPTSLLTVLLFDREGRPLPWTVEGYFHADQQGVADLLDLNQDGRAELLYMSYGNGFWATQLYSAQETHWLEVVGPFLKRKYPLYTRFTYRPQHQALAKPPVLGPVLSRLDNHHLQFSGTLTDFKWADVSVSENIQLSLMSEKGQISSCEPSAWHSTFSVVLDGSQGRQMANLSQPEAVKHLLQQIQRQALPIQLFGQRGNEGCRPELLWASEPRKVDF